MHFFLKAERPINIINSVTIIGKYNLNDNTIMNQTRQTVKQSEYIEQKLSKQIK